MSVSNIRMSVHFRSEGFKQYLDEMESPKRVKCQWQCFYSCSSLYLAQHVHMETLRSLLKPFIHDRGSCQGRGRPLLFWILYLVCLLVAVVCLLLYYFFLVFVYFLSLHLFVCLCEAVLLYVWLNLSTWKHFGGSCQGRGRPLLF